MLVMVYFFNCHNLVFVVMIVNCEVWGGQLHVEGWTD